MKRNRLNFIIDSLAFTVCTGLITTAVIMRFVLPPGSGGRGRLLHDGRGSEHIKTLLSMTRHNWGDIHFYFAISFALLLTLHLILHFDWIKNSLAPLKNFLSGFYLGNEKRQAFSFDFVRCG